MTISIKEAFTNRQFNQGKITGMIGIGDRDTIPKIDGGDPSGGDLMG
jgi:hypothetical protein